MSDAAPTLATPPPPAIGVSNRAATTVVNVVPAAGVEKVPPVTVEAPPRNSIAPALTLPEIVTVPPAGPVKTAVSPRLLFQLT